MNSPAIRQNTNSWSSLFAAHLAGVETRSADALAKTGYDALLVHAGTPPLRLLTLPPRPPIRLLLRPKPRSSNR